jgi:hypothetical protein
MQWEYPVYQRTEDRHHSDATAVVPKRAALTREEALAYIAGKDPRPLLVLRECSHCNKTDDALLTPGFDNEKVLFLTRWFHCVKLPVDVIQHDHPFNALFASDEAEHLFVATHDGSMKIPLESSTSRPELCAAMSQVLGASYAKDPSPMFKDLHTLGDQFDTLDEHIRALKQKKSELMESKIPDKAKLAKLDSQIAACQKEINDKKAAFEHNTTVPLRAPDATAKANEPKSSR